MSPALSTVTLLAVVVLAAAAAAACGNGADAPTDAELRDALLTINQMPDGWSGGVVTPAASTNNVCGLEIREEGHAGRHQSGFRQTAGPQAITHTVMHYPDGASEQIARIRAAFNSCEEWTIQAGEAQPTVATVRVETLDLAPLGDESAAYGLDIKVEGRDDLGYGAFVAVRYGEIITTYVYTSTGEPLDRELLDRFVQLTDGKLSANER